MRGNKSGKVRSEPMAPALASALAKLGQRECWTGPDESVDLAKARAASSPRPRAHPWTTMPLGRNSVPLPAPAAPTAVRHRAWAQPPASQAIGAICRAKGDTGSVMEPRGAYSAERAAALSGVPKSTVHYWARTDVLVPSISPERVKLWSFPDLMGLRTIYWLRQDKALDEGHDIPKTTMRAVRAALADLRDLQVELWNEEAGPSVAVDRAGRIHVRGTNTVVSAEGDRALGPDLLDLVAPFRTREGLRGPNLFAPRPRLRIVPGKLAGSPHVERSRVETQALAALADRDLPLAKIYKLYPSLAPEAVSEALDLERQLSANLRLAA